jgi:hypothetical protein
MTEEIVFYRITHFSGDAAKHAETKAWGESIRPQFKALGARSIDLVDLGGGQFVVVAAYPDRATADRGVPVAQAAFGDGIAKGYVDPKSIRREEGDVMVALA